MKNARLLFEQGHHRDVVDQVSMPGRTNEDSMALIGSLAFLGRLEEAVEVWSLRSKALKPAQRSRARFALALAYTRISKFKTARKWLRESLDESRELPDVYQGLAVYHFYLGNFEKAAKNARLALNLAIKLSDSYIHAFAIDLYGHSLVQTGQRSAGLAKLKQARELSNGHADPYTPAILNYEAEAGLRASTIVSEIEKQISEIRTEDTYTHANLILELSRQLTLRGQWSRAREALDSVSSLVYAFRNRRQEATLQLRLAELAYRQGDFSNAMHFTQAARRCLNKIADAAYEARVAGLERKIERAQGRTPAAEPSVEGASMAARISQRARGIRRASAGDDPLGDLLDRVSENPSGNASELLKAGYYGLWPEAAGFKAGHSALVILDDLKWVAVSREGVIACDHSLSSMSYKILRLLARGTVGKERLVKEAWGYEYDPARHDSMIYAALAALRKAMGAAGHWIETQDDGWRLANRGQFISFTDRETPDLAKPTQDVVIENGLNWRQLKAMARLKPREPWTVPLYKDLFEVSTMTAWRDLDLLAKAGYLTRIGRGRATVYLQAQTLENL